MDTIVFNFKIIIKFNSKYYSIKIHILCFMVKKTATGSGGYCSFRLSYDYVSEDSYYSSF